MNFHKDIQRFLYTPQGTQKKPEGETMPNQGLVDGNPQPNEQMYANESRESLPVGGIPLGKGIMLRITSIPYAFTLPHRYHERLEFDVASHHPKAKILLNRRVGYLGAATPVRYSLLAYLESGHDFEVKIAGAALNNMEAWSFNTLIPLKDLGIGIAKTLEHIAALPIHNAVDFNLPRTPPVRNKQLFANKSFCDKA